MKKFLSIVVGLILCAPLAFAASDVTLTGGDTVISVGGYNLTVSGTYSVNSISVSSSSFDVALPANSSINISSHDRRQFSVSPTTSVTVTKTCLSTESLVEVSTGGSAETVTITPSTSNLCTAASSSSSGGNGPIIGGGSGSLANYSYGSSVSAAPAASAATPAIPAAPAVTSASPVAKAVSTAFNREMEIGMSGPDVTALQQYLAKDPALYPQGLVTGYFGSLTRKAVRAFQKKYGISQVGRVGPQTLAQLNKLSGTESTAVPASSSATVDQLQSMIQALQAQIQALQNQAR
ncbi:MAG: peptidoglycan-binding protein [Patescibacteria group bacterium]|nr:peptidoglycan-binding protein [Patescibacteria group bacterium]